LSRSVIVASTQSAHSASLFEAHFVDSGRLAAAGAGSDLSGRAAVDLHAASNSTAASSAHEYFRAGSRPLVVTS